MVCRTDRGAREVRHVTQGSVPYGVVVTSRIETLHWQAVEEETGTGWVGMTGL